MAWNDLIGTLWWECPGAVPGHSRGPSRSNETMCFL